MQDAFESTHPSERARNREREEADKGPFTDVFRAIKVKDAVIKVSKDVQFEDVIFTTLNRSNQIDKKRMRGNTSFECYEGPNDYRNLY